MQTGHAHGGKELLLQIFFQIDALFEEGGGEHIGGDGIVAEDLAGHVGKDHVDEEAFDEVMAELFLGLAGGHAQAVAQGEGLELFTGLALELVGEDIHDLFVQIKDAFVCGDADGDGGKGLGQGIDGLQLVGRIGCVIRLGKDLIVTDEDKGMEIDTACLYRIDKSRNI